MAQRDKPLLHLVPSSGDPGTHSDELDWFFRTLDSESGNRSAMGGQLLAVWNGTNAVSNMRESNFYTDAQAGWPSMLRRIDGSIMGGAAGCIFRRGRAVWRSLVCLTWAQQWDLARWYEHRRHIPAEWEQVPDERVRDAHRAYYAAREADHGHA